MAPIALLAVTAAVSAYGAMSAAKAQSASYKSQQNAANYNATANQQNAQSAEAAASANELALRRQNDQRMGAMRAQAAESGGFTGSNLEVLDQSGANMELDALNTRYRGATQARGLLDQSTLDQAQAQGAGMNASSATSAGYINAAGSALGSFSNYYNFRGINQGGYG